MAVSSLAVSFPTLIDAVPGRCVPATAPRVSDFVTNSGLHLSESVPISLTVSSMDPEIASRVTKNELFDLLDDSDRARFPHLQIEDSDGSSAKQIKCLSTEILLLRYQLSNKIVEKSPLSNQVVSVSSWKDVVSPAMEVKRLALQYFPPTSVNDRILVTPPSGLGEAGVEKWKNCMVGFFLDKKLPFLSVQSIAFNAWGKKGLVDVLSNDNGFFFFQFNSREDYLSIIDQGPWHFGGKLLMLKPWEVGMSFEKEQLSKIPIWVQFYNIPLEYWTAGGFSFVASAIGRPLYAASFTESGKRISYARICVEIDIDWTVPLATTKQVWVAKPPVVAPPNVPLVVSPMLVTTTAPLDTNVQLGVVSSNSFGILEGIYKEASVPLVAKSGTSLTSPLVGSSMVNSRGVKTVVGKCLVMSVQSGDSGKGHGKASKTHAIVDSPRQSTKAVKSGVLGDIAAMGFSGEDIQVLGGPTDFVVALDGNDDKIANLPSDEEFAEGLKSVSTEEITTKKLFFLSIVYGGNSTVQRRELWSEMRYIHGIIGSQCWIQLGDFNILSAQEFLRKN
ncbi:hypothetical protein RHGRI_017610 [Rhododendron griersonianum]|uniref:DUF4283 domain-containing protein n=1 Tax=Rhododendron griersonianum TaxID=479676 RepID=A0AAV6JYD1_9ERIC|nr:hypothetical protein RHGRI_017610 [Rhododendron griersonianum]